MAKNHNRFIAPIEKLTQLSYAALLGLWLSLAAIFGVAYFLLAIFAPAHGPVQLISQQNALWMLFDCIYYSIITATSTGYGDITPQGFSKLLASLQSITALVVFAIFVTKLVSQKQEMALREVHRLTFQDMFHNIREGLFILRKDCDRIMQDAQDGKLSDDHWQDLTIIYRQAQTFVQEIPNFYATDESKEEAGIYTIDKQREQLLHEAVHRTLHRINQMLDTLSKYNVDWSGVEESMQELEKLVQIVRRVTPLWEKESPHKENHEAFEDILQMNENIHKRLAEATVA